MRSLRMWFNMTLTPSDVASLTSTLTCWEYAEYVSGGFVALACAGEYIASFKPWFTGGDKERKERLEKRSTLLLIIALAAELICLVRTNQISGQVIGALDTKAAEAYRKSDTAIANADSALDKAGAASDEADSAKSESGKAKSVANLAELTAKGARQQADAFEGRIVSATDIATKAESHLAEALRRTAAAETALERVRTPRSLTDIPGLLSAMERFRGTSYTFTNVFADEDSARLMRAIDEILQRAGWNRVITPAIGIPSFDVFGSNNFRFTVLAALTDGVRVSVDIPMDIDVLRATPQEDNPMFINAAVALDIALFASIFPPEDDFKQPPVVVTTKGPSQIVRISVGKKR
jgi:hypothetical protein